MKKQRRTLFSTINLVLVLAILLLVNLISMRGFTKWDLTSAGAYSLSDISRETLARAEDPLRVKVYYSPQVPSPYNGVRQYLLDLLREYDGAGGRSFSYEIVDVTAPEGRLEAQDYGLQEVEIQEIRSDEFQARSVLMGAVVLYGNVVERVDRITGTNGLEYRLTLAMRSAISQVDALAGTTEPVTLMTFVSPALRDLGIEGIAEFSDRMEAIYQRVNRDNYQRIAYESFEPTSPEDVQRYMEEYDLQGLRWESQPGVQQQGLLEVVITYGDRIEQVPVPIYSGLFGGYSLPDEEALEESVRASLRSLVNASPTVGYITGGGTKSISDYQRGSGPFGDLLSERVEVVELDPGTESIPAGIDTLILNGPTEDFSEAALFRIDQFLMGGGSLFVLIDRHIQELPTQQQMMMGQQPTWRVNGSNVIDLLEGYGFSIGNEIVLDEESFVSQQGGRRQQLFQAPVLGGRSINRDSVITAGLEDLIVLNAVEVSLDAESESAAETALLTSSSRSWTVPSPQDIGPWTEGLPGEDMAAQYDLASLYEGDLQSYFDGPVELPLESLDEAAAADGSPGGAAPDDVQPADQETAIGRGSFTAASTEPAKILVIGSAALTTAQMLDAQSRTPNSSFLLNAVDYLNGAPGFAELRSKGLGVPRLDPVTGTLSTTLRWGNTILAPVLTLLVGLVVLLRRRGRSRRIRAAFAESESKHDEVTR